jgi:hypothetical protein
MSSRPRRHSFSEGMTHIPFKHPLSLLKPSVTPRELATAQRMLKGYAHGARVRDVFRMVNEHNRKIKKSKKAKSVTWSDQSLGTSHHKPLPRRHGPAVMWEGR